LLQCAPGIRRRPPAESLHCFSNAFLPPAFLQSRGHAACPRSETRARSQRAGTPRVQSVSDLGIPS
jgi:hypothetical protein